MKPAGRFHVREKTRPDVLHGDRLGGYVDEINFRCADAIDIVGQPLRRIPLEFGIWHDFFDLIEVDQVVQRIFSQSDTEQRGQTYDGVREDSSR